jgi:branched-chain amino acid transport system substrate-binding protein
MRRAARVLARAMIFGAALLAAHAARAEDPIKIGFLIPLSGQFADIGEKMNHGAQLWMQLHGDTVAGRKIEIVTRDANGINPEQTKRLAQELITRDKVSFLTGFGLTPDALATAPLGTAAKVPMVIMNAATGYLTQKSPYFVRVSFTLSQLETPFGEWAAKQGVKKVYIAISDFAPGYEAEAAFKKAYTAAGGEVIGEVRVPIKDMEMAPYVQRIKDAHPEGVFVFMPTGQLPLNFVRQFIQLGLKDAGVQLLGASEIIDDTVIQTLGDATLGVYSVQNYSYPHASKLNQEYVKAYKAAFGARPRPDFLSVAAYDGMNAIYQAIAKLNGVMDGEKALAALETVKIDSPRGPVEIDPATREPIENVYVRKVEKIDGQIVNAEVAEFKHVKVPGT